MRTVRIFLAVTLSLATAGSAPVIVTAATATAVRPVTTCAGLVREIALPGATTHVTSAAVVPATGADPEYCGVQGYVEPAVRFDLRLPTKTYAGRYLQYGCGSFCGLLTPPAFADCGLPHGGDVAVAATDDGHVGRTPGIIDDGSWGAHDQAARDDFEFRAPHVVSRAAKAIIQAFYGSPPAKSYFTGCSDGGREGLLLAQRYPADFDGIVAGAPGGAWSPLMGFLAWLARVNTAADGSPILTAAKLPALHNAVLAACDGLDGLTDGQLDDPRACHFDPGTLTCAGPDTPACLTPAQVAATRKLYSPPTDTDGTLLYPGGEQPGSELEWASWVIGSGGPGLARTEADNYLRHLGYPIGAPAVDGRHLRLHPAPSSTGSPRSAPAYNAMSPDLTAFQRRGGKLVLWHGWADQAIPPTGTLDYYQRLTERSGGLARTQDWARLFMVPSLYHCGGGTTLTDVRPAARAGRLGRTRHGAGSGHRDRPGHHRRTSPAPVRCSRTRSARSTTAPAASTTPRTSVPRRRSPPPHDVVDWAGNGLYALPGPVAR